MELFIKIALIVIGIIAVLFVFWIVAHFAGSRDMLNNRADEVQEYLKQPEYVFIDVREPFEYKAGHIKGALNIPISSLQSGYKSLPANKTLVLVCRSGHRSSMAYNFLKSKNFKNLINLNGCLLYTSEAETVS